MRIVVTGASGFIGRHLVLELAAFGHDVSSMSRQEMPPPGVAVHYAGNVCATETWRQVGAVDAVVHLAGLSDASLSHIRPLEYNTVNAVGALAGLEAARRQGALFLLASSQRVYRPSEQPLSEDDPREPVDAYGYSKLVAEHWVEMYNRVFGVHGIVLRFFSVYGPGQLAGGGSSGVVALFSTRAMRGDDLTVHGRVWRDFTYVSDVVAGIRLALDKGRSGAVYNIATGSPTSTEDLARMVVAVTGSRSAIRVENPTHHGDSYVAAIGRARDELGYRPAIMLRQGLEHYVEWLRERR